MTKEDIIKNEYIRGNVGVVSIVEKINKNILRWFRHVKRSDNSEIVKVVMEINVEIT